ncbi:MAG: type II toxin-antitoxin system VapC family toxin [Verrucomicrobia bacterium]|nr:type II toxin-antitoxin system VapC family toxin [Verrucomicrobiota bacterium]
MAANPKKQLALDTNLLLDLAEEKDWAEDFREEFQTRGYTLRIGPTVVLELEWLSSFAGEPQRTYAGRAAERISIWRITPFELSSLDQAIAERFGETLLDQKLIPGDELNDSIILAETSLASIPLLVTSDKHLLDIDEIALRLAFNDADLLQVSPVHPRRLLRAMR